MGNDRRRVPALTVCALSRTLPPRESRKRGRGGEKEGGRERGYREEGVVTSGWGCDVLSDPLMGVVRYPGEVYRSPVVCSV